MNDKREFDTLIESYYESWFEINNIYHVWAREHGIQDTTLFVFYIIKNSSDGCTQNKICSKLLLPKQTVSLILSGLEKDGYIFREVNPEDRRNKIVKLTEKGEEFAKPILEEMKQLEIRAFNKMSLEQRRSVVEGFKILSDSLADSFQK
ncbi:MarR family transcriptional regulator [Clostridium zeae]|uniref:MarR family transcriptional regulator n=1 Tax=Clostridium zeae TaxID=2759022 RepID=A0ABQ1EA33_9CLOT|nr:MarR family transcriptional regulator [Clostridium zeae]GFZ31643.1 MarR family transcriptional regulator [Clostridium zeae]